MVLLSIIWKNFKAISKNFLLLAFLTVMPLMQLYLINVTTVNAAAEVAESINSGFVEIFIVSRIVNNDMLQLYAAAILTQFLLMTSMIAGAYIVTEREENTMIRVCVAPISKLKVLSGILLGHSITVLLVALVIISASYRFFSVNWGDSLLNLIAITLMAVYVATAMAFIISGIFRNSNVAGGVMSIVVIAMTFTSGGLIQSDKLEKVSNFTINKWISDAYLILAEGGRLRDISLNLTILALIGTLLMLLASLLYRRENVYE